MYGLIAIYYYKLKIVIFIFRILRFPHIYNVYIWIILRITLSLAALKLSICMIDDTWYSRTDAVI